MSSVAFGEKCGTIKRSDSTIKLKKTKIARGCEIITREDFVEKKKRKEEEVKQEKERTTRKKLKTKEIQKEPEEMDQIKKPNCIKSTNESKVKKVISHKSIPKKKKKSAAKNSKKRVKDQKKRYDSSESQDESVIILDLSDSAELSCQNFDCYRENILAEMENDVDFIEDLYTEEKENDKTYLNNDANVTVNDKFKSNVGSRNPEINDWVLV
ncbi:histone-lysine N-methyltransferase, H3 lysine-79 specific-like [Galleria mellonella]|uniref:Histone-lysine N-methyltransferase, H3 lysine-79 specific-like n=1 Tax=Galleria mellonella TaxID=7137 RepID=A0ABM3N0Q9_GALME|nr:histone-lysine N-methyltransferase, H3 lysine-79 specific-like [Galleria mellonella]